MVDRKVVDSLKLLERALRDVLPEEGIGGSKSRGLGKVAVENLILDEVTTETLEKRAQEIDVLNFVVEFISPMVLDGGKLLDAPALLEAARRAYSWCFQEGKPKLPEVELVEKRCSFEMYTGWSLKEDRRKRVEVAVSPGSVFHFRSTQADRTLALALAALELYAIGTYKSHGCGQIKIRSLGGENK